MKRTVQPSQPYESGLREDLRDPDEAAAYLNAAIEDGSQEGFLLALRDVADARGVASVAREAMLNRENAYRILSEKGNPQLSSLTALLDALGLKLAVAVKGSAAA
jgi:probable addiction module antidote protein